MRGADGEIGKLVLQVEVAAWIDEWKGGDQGEATQTHLSPPPTAENPTLAKRDAEEGFEGGAKETGLVCSWRAACFRQKGGGVEMGKPIVIYWHVLDIIVQ